VGRSHAHLLVNHSAWCLHIRFGLGCSRHGIACAVEYIFFLGLLGPERHGVGEDT
jgi:hypothetical protein